MKIGLISASRQNHNGVQAVVLGIKEYLGDRGILIGPQHPRSGPNHGIWLPSRCYSKSDDYYDVLLTDSLTNQEIRQALASLDIVHLHSASILTYRTLRALETMNRKPKVISHVHTHFADYNRVRFGNAVSSLTTPALVKLYQYHVEMADLVLFPTTWARNVLGDIIGIARDDPRAAVWGAPVSEYAAETDSPVVQDALNGQMPGNQPFLYFVGRLGKEKYIDRMIRLFQWINQVIDSQIVLVISGFGDQSPYRKIAQDLGVDDKVYFTGQVTEGTVCALSRRAISAISCCRNETQALGNLRQMLCSLPLIAVEGTVLCDHVWTSGGGVVFDGSKDHPSIREFSKLEQLLTNDALRAQKGRNARAYVLGNFSPERQYAALDKLYSKLNSG